MIVNSINRSGMKTELVAPKQNDIYISRSGSVHIFYDCNLQPQKINEHGSHTGKHYIDAFSQWITGGMLPNAVLIIIEY